MAAAKTPLWLSALLNFVAGGLTIVAFAPWAWYPIAVFTLAFVLPSWLRNKPAAAFKLGILFGLSYGVGSSYWIYYSLHDFGQAPAALAILAAVLLAAVLSLFFAALAMLVSYHRRQPIAVVCLVVFPALWVLMEWGRSALFVGFPWNLLGQAVIDSPWYGVLPTFGVLGGSALLALCAGSLVCFFYLRAHGKIVLSISLAVALLGLSMLRFVDWSNDTGEQLKVSLIQANIPQKIKFDRAYFERLMTRHLNLSAPHFTGHAPPALSPSDLIIWPETAIPLYADLLETQLASLRRQLAAHGSTLVTGIFYRDKAQQKRYNSLMDVNNNRFYHKRRLVPFGEYIPLRFIFDAFSDWVNIPMSDLHAAAAAPIMELAGHTAGVSICYEVAFADDIADSLPQAGFLINLSNDSWFGDSLAPHQMLQMARVRAAESARYMARATNTGISAIIDAHGRITAQSPLFESGVSSGSIEIREGSTPYTQWRNIPVWLWMIGALLSPWLWTLYAQRRSLQRTAKQRP